MKKLVLLLAFLLTTVCLHAQETGFHRGAIITKDNERIEGLVKNVNLVPARILEGVKFKTAEGEKVTTYSPGEILGYMVGNDVFVTKKSASGNEMFVKKFNRGKLELYGLMTFDGTQARNVVYKPYLQLEGDPVIHLVDEIGFKKQLLKYLKDAPNVCREIKDRTLRYIDIDVIVNQYNKEVSGN